MSYQSEAQLEQQLIDQLQSQNYKVIALPDYNALLSNFKAQFEAFNAHKLGGKALSSKEWERVLNFINGKSIFESAKILRDKFVLERDDGTRPYLQFIDEDYSKNLFQVTHQMTVVGKYINRYDVTLLINGLPLAQIELKRRGVDIKEAVNQIMRYRKHSYLYRDEKVVFIVDECHRSQFGDMHKDIVRHFTKAQFFGFTGTPRFEINGKVEGKVTQTTISVDRLLI